MARRALDDVRRRYGIRPEEEDRLPSIIANWGPEKVAELAVELFELLSETGSLSQASSFHGTIPHAPPSPSSQQAEAFRCRIAPLRSRQGSVDGGLSNQDGCTDHSFVPSELSVDAQVQTEASWFIAAEAKAPTPSDVTLSPASVLDVPTVTVTRDTDGPPNLLLPSAVTPPPRDCQPPVFPTKELRALTLGSPDPRALEPGAAFDDSCPPSCMASMKLNRCAKRAEMGFITVNNYVFTDVIGRGSNSVVYLATQLSDADEPVRQVAVKIVPRERVTGRRKMGSMSPAPSGGLPFGTHSPPPARETTTLLHEIAVMKKVRNEHVMRLIEAIDDEDHQFIYLVMPYAELGPVLKKAADNQRYIRLTETSALKYLKQIAKGLLYLHDLGIVHRDIKPDNILLAEGRLYIADFGMADILEDASSVEDGHFFRHIGTPAFHAPEVDNLSPNSGDTDGSKKKKALDMWAVGITFYMMITGVLPFTFSPEFSEDVEGTALRLTDPSFFSEYRKQIATTDIKFPRYFVENHLVSFHTMSILEGLLRRNPANRFSAKQLLQRLLRATRVVAAVESGRQDEHQADEGVSNVLTPNGSLVMSDAEKIEVTTQDIEAALTHPSASRLPRNYSTQLFSAVTSPVASPVMPALQPARGKQV